MAQATLQRPHLLVVTEHRHLRLKEMLVDQAQFFHPMQGLVGAERLPQEEILRSMCQAVMAGMVRLPPFLDHRSLMPEEVEVDRQQVL